MTSLWRTGWVTILCLLLIVPLTSSQIYEGQCELDLIFLVDAGSSTGNSNFRKLLRAITDYVSTEFPVAEEAVHVGVIAFSTTPDAVHLTGDLQELIDGVNRLPYKGRLTYTHSAFEMALRDLQSSSRAATAAKVVILFTDNEAGITNLAEERAEDLRDYGADIWCVGIGARAPSQELYTFTGGDSDRVILTRSYSAVPEAIDLPVACTVYYPPPPPPPPTSVVEDTSTIETAWRTTSDVSDKESSTATFSESIATKNATSIETEPMSATPSGTIAASSNLNSQTIHHTSSQPTATLDVAQTETATISEKIDTTSTINNQRNDSTIIQDTVTSHVAHTKTTTVHESFSTLNGVDNGSTDRTSIQPTATWDIVHTETATVNHWSTTPNSVDNQITNQTTSRRIATTDIAYTETAMISELMDKTITFNNHRTESTANHPTATLDIAHTETATINEGMDSTNSMGNHGTDHTSYQPTATWHMSHSETRSNYEDMDSTKSMDNHRTVPTLIVSPTPIRDVSHTIEDVTSDVGHTEDFSPSPTQTRPLPTSIHTMSYSVSRYVTPIDSTAVTSAPPPSSTPNTIPDRNTKDLLCSKAAEVDGLWLTSHPTDCDKFVQCHYDTEGRLTTAVRLCPRGLFWSKTSSNCLDPKDAHCSMDPCRNREVDTYNMDGGCGLYWRCLDRVSHGESCKRGYAYTALEGCIPSPRCKTASISDETCGNEGLCQRMPLRSNRGYQTLLHAIPGDWIAIPCMYGATFDLASCSCLNSRPFASDCQHIVKIERQHETNLTGRSTSLIFDPTSSRPIALRFRYKPSPSIDDNKKGEILVRSSECSMGGLFLLWEEEDFLETRVFSRDGYFLRASLPLHGLNTTEWRTVDVRFTYSGDLSVKLISGHLTFTNYIEGGLHLPLALCGWDAGLPGSLAEEVSPFQGDMEEIYISRCYDHGF